MANKEHNPWLWTIDGRSKLPGWISAGLIILISAFFTFFGPSGASEMGLCVLIPSLLLPVIIRTIP